MKLASQRLIPISPAGPATWVYSARESDWCLRVDFEQRLRLLPEHLRFVAQMLLDEATEKEIASALRVSRGTVLYWIRKLRTYLQPHLATA